MATGTLRIVLVAVALAVGGFVIARAFPSAPAVAEPEEGGDPGDTTEPGNDTGPGAGQPGGTGGQQDQGDATDVRVQVQNGTGVADLAADTASFIDDSLDLGFASVEAADAANPAAETTIYYKPDVRDLAERLRDEAFKGAALRSATPDSERYDIIVLLGADYVGNN